MPVLCHGSRRRRCRHPGPFGTKMSGVWRRAMSDAAAARSLRAVVVPEWLAEVVRPRRAPVPWPEMARAALAICVPLSASYAAGRGTLGVLPATGGLLGTMADAGGPYLSRVKRVCSFRLMACMGAAGVVSEVLPLQRSY